MSARTTMFQSWLVALTCLVSAGAGLLARRPALADAAPATVHGLRPMPDDRMVPPQWLPPGTADPDMGPSDVIYPPQKMTLRFSHVKHLKEAGATCATCHDKAKTSTKADDSLLPTGTTCDTCHDTDHTDLANVKGGEDAMGKCQFCHLGYRAEDGNRVVALAFPPPNLRFNHKVHVARNIACGQCHGSVEELELATRDQLPRMKGCFGCHNMSGASQGEAKSACNTCHLAVPDGRMKTVFASGDLKPPRWLHNAQHTPDFVERHKRIAADDSAFCANCHKEDYCTDCHDGKIRPRNVHPNDWISMHPIAGRQDNPRCTTCHREQSFCVECHQRAGVTMGGANPQGRSFHPPGWATLGTRGPGHHAWEAQRNIGACVSCHTERDCAVCHASSGRQGLGVSPHPQGFASSCSGPLRRNARPCLVCHEQTSSELAMCR